MSQYSLALILIFEAVLLNHSGAVEITSTIVDGLGRPVAGVTVEVKYPKAGRRGKLEKVEWLKSISNEKGSIKIVYDERLVATNETIWVNVSKPGYAAVSTDTIKTQYVLQRRFTAEDIRRIARLSGKEQRTELREFLAGDFERKAEDGHQTGQDLIFFHGRELREALRDLIDDNKVCKAACASLAFIGVPDDLRLIAKRVPAPKRELFEDRWAYGAVCSLLEPHTKEEWAFLSRCAANAYDDLWVDAAAIRTLKLIGSRQSANILRAVVEKNPGRKELITEALLSIEKGPLDLADPDLEKAGKNVAQILGIGTWKGNKAPRFNREKDMALVDCEFTAGRDLLVETATFHKVGNLWKLRGVRETMQALMANPPDKTSFVGSWHGFSEGHLEFARLELNEDGTGLLAISFLPNAPPNTYVVTNWSVRDFELDIAVEIADPDAEPIKLENVGFAIDALELKMLPVHGGNWSRKMILFNETTFQQRSEAARKGLESIRRIPK